MLLREILKRKGKVASGSFEKGLEKERKGKIKSFKEAGNLQLVKKGTSGMKIIGI